MCTPKPKRTNELTRRYGTKRCASDPAPGRIQPSRRLEFPGKDQEKLRAVIHTNAARVVGEGYYYNDLRAGGEAENVNNGPIRKFNNDVILVRSFEPSRDYWWPVPQGEIDLNRNLLPNNPNY